MGYGLNEDLSRKLVNHLNPKSTVITTPIISYRSGGGSAHPPVAGRPLGESGHRSWDALGTRDTQRHPEARIAGYSGEVFQPVDWANRHAECSSHVG